MDVLPREFADPPYGSLEAAACSPRVDDRQFRGIVIRLPERIRLRSDETLLLPICGYYQLATQPLVQGAVMVVHVRGAGGTPFPPESGQVVVDHGENEPNVPDSAAEAPIDPRLYAHSVSESYFFLDGQRYLKGQLPAGNYEVVVSFGDARSNLAQVAIARD